MSESPALLTDGEFRPAPPRQSQRRFARVPLHAEVQLRRSGQNNYRVDVYDLSPNGCRVEFVEQPLLRELLWVKFQGLESLPAHVCWTKGALAGLEFPRPIHPAVFDLLVKRLKAG